MLTNEDLEQIRQIVREEIENRHQAQHEAYREGVKASFFSPVDMFEKGENHAD